MELEEFLQSTQDNISGLYPTAVVLFPRFYDPNYTISNLSDTQLNEVDTTYDDGQASLVVVFLVWSVVGMLVIVTFGGNMLVLLSFVVERQLRTVTNSFIISLAVADLVIGAVSMPFYTIYLLRGNMWPFSALICDIWLCVDYTMSNASVANLIIICLDRYLSITRPLSYRANRTSRRVALMIALAWFISFTLWPPWIISWQYIEQQRTVPPTDCYIQFLASEETYSKVITVITALCAFYIPAILMCAMYFVIYLKTRQRRMQMATLQAVKRTKVDECETAFVESPSARASIAESSGCVDTESNDAAASNVNGTAKKYPSKSPPSVLKIVKHSTEVSPDSPTSADENMTQTVSRLIVETSKTASKPMPVYPPMEAKSQKQEKSRKSHDSKYSTVTIKMSDTKARITSTHGSDSSECSDEDDDEDDNEESEILAKAAEKKAKPAQKQRKTIFSRKPNAVTESKPNPKSSPVQGSHERSVSNNPHTKSPSTETSLKNTLKRKNRERKAKKQSDKRQERKAAKILSAILLVFIVTWTPYNLFTIWEQFCRNCVPATLQKIGYWMCYINSTINPFCYALCNITFRTTFKRILTCERKKITKHKVLVRQRVEPKKFRTEYTRPGGGIKSPLKRTTNS